MVLIGHSSVFSIDLNVYTQRLIKWTLKWINEATKQNKKIVFTLMLPSSDKKNKQIYHIPGHLTLKHI